MDESKQKGPNFSSRITYAFKQLFEQGYKNVISIGNDTPGLEVAHIERAIKHLEKGKAVIGPSSDGGAYLIGLNRSQFETSDFKNLPWQKEELCSQLCANIFTKNHSLFFLAELNDLDTAEDLFNFVNQNPYSLLALISRAYPDQNISRFETIKVFFIKQAYYATGPLRAPPLQRAA